MSKEYPWGKGTPKRSYDDTANDSDKTFTVPAGKVWRVERIYFELDATATVGNRSLMIIIGDGTNAIWRSPATANIAATQKGAYEASPVFSSYLTTIPTTTLAGSSATAKTTVFLPVIIMPAGWTIRMYDVNAIDAAADDMICIINYVEYDA